MSESGFNSKIKVSVEFDADELSLMTGALEKAQESADKFSEGLDGLEKKITQANAAIQKASRGTSDLGTQLDNGKRKQQEYAAGFDELIKRLNEYNSAAARAAQASVVGGGRNPLGAAMGTMNLEEAREVIAITEAANMTAIRSARQIVDAEKRKQEALAATIKMRLEEQSRAAGLRSDASAQGAAWRNANSVADEERARAQELRGLREAIIGRAKAEDEAALASKRAADANAKHEASLPSLRYALYDVATTAGVVSAAITGTGVAVLAASAKYESAFTNVERTTLATAETTSQLREDLLQLTREIPESWGNITEIASIGAQLDIADDSLAQFTETTTKFSTVTGVSAEQSAMAFGSLGQLLGVTAGEYENMGSAIAYVGVTSVATDAEIIKMSQRLAASAANAGMTAQEVIALSGALASLRIAPERAQGVMEVYFKSLNNAIADGGPRLEAFARYAGVATEAVAGMVETDPAGFFRSLSAGLGSLDPVSTTLALEELGLSGIRAGEVFTRVSNNLGVFDQALMNSNKAWAEGSHLADAYGLVVDDLTSKWQIFLNGLTELGAAIGDVIAPFAKAALDVLTPVINALSQFVQTPFGSVATGVAVAIGALVALFAAAVSGSALFLASMAAMSTAVKELGISAGVSAFSLTGLRAAFASVAGTAGMSTAAINGFKIALASTGIGIAVVALGTLATAFASAADSTASADAAFSQFIGGTGGLSEALAADAAARAEAIASGNYEVAESFTRVTQTSYENSESTNENTEARKAALEFLGQSTEGLSASSQAIQTNTVYIGENTQAWLRNMLMQGEFFKELMNNQGATEAMSRLGVNVDDLLAAAVLGENALNEYWVGIINANRSRGQAAINDAAAISSAFGSVMANALNGVMGSNIKLSGAKLKEQVGSAIKFDTSLLGGDSIWKKLNNTVLGAGNAIKLFQNSTSGANQALREGAGAADDYANSLGGAGNAAEDAAQKVYTLKDYAGDLAKIWERAFEIRFSGQQTLDTITSAWSKIRKETNDAADAIRKYQAELQTLSADKSTLQYWLMVAENYGDVLRAEEVRAKLAEQDVKIAEASKKLAAEQDKTNKTLEGNSDAAIANRRELANLVQQYQSHIGALAASGMSSEELSATTARLKQQFIEQAVQLGFSQTEVLKYAAAFDDVTFAISKIPRNITVAANTNPAIQAFNEMKAAADRANSSVGSLRGNLGSGFGSGPVNYSSITAAGLAAEKARLQQGLMLSAFGSPNAGSALSPYSLDGARSRVNQLAAMGFRKGGYTGNGGVNDPAGFVHGKEFVFSAPAVQNIGLRNLAALHDAAKNGRSAPATSMGMGGPIQVELSPIDRQLLIDVKRAAGVSISGDALTRAAVAGSVNAGRTGRG